jgi:hypothetical protein
LWCGRDRRSIKDNDTGHGPAAKVGIYGARRYRFGDLLYVGEAQAIKGLHAVFGSGVLRPYSLCRCQWDGTVKPGRERVIKAFLLFSCLTALLPPSCHPAANRSAKMARVIGLVMNDVWNTLFDEMQVVIAHEALCRAALMLAHQSELLAEEIEAGHVPDRGGPEALRLNAAIVRAEVAAKEYAGHA